MLGLEIRVFRCARGVSKRFAVLVAWEFRASGFLRSGLFAFGAFNLARCLMFWP